MLQEVVVVAVGEVGSLVRAARLRALQRRVRDRLADIEQEAELDRRRELGVEALAVVVDGDVLEALLELADLLRRGAAAWASSR